MRFCGQQRTLLWSSGFSVVLGLISQHCWAAGFAIKSQSASNLGTAGAADTGGIQDISAIFSNPAAIGAFGGQRFSLGLAAIQLNAKFKDGERTYPTLGTPVATESKTEMSDFTEGGYAPALFGVHQVSDAVNIGWSLTVPFSTKTNYGSDWVGRYHGIKTELQMTNLDVGGSFKVLTNLIVGAGVQVQHAKGVLSGASNLGALSVLKAGADAQSALIAADSGDASKIGALTGTAKAFADSYVKAIGSGTSKAVAGQQLQQTVATAVATADGKADVVASYTGENIGYGGNIGVLYSPIESLDIGLSYRSSVEHDSKGDITFTGDSAQASAYVDSQEYEKEGKLKLRLPAVVSFGAAYKPMKDLTLYANVTQTQWSSLKAIDLKYKNASGDQSLLTKLDWKDAVYMGLGVAYNLDSRIVLRTGIAKDNTPSQDNLRSPRSPDNDRTIMALGGGYAGDGWQVDAGLTHIAMKDPSLHLKESDYAEANGRGDLSGKYEITANTLMVQYGYQL